MKKFLLPLAALLIGGASVQAEEVTVKYYGNVYGTNELSDTELFQPTTHEVVDNGDGTYTLIHFLNAKSNQGLYKDLKFTFDANGVISYPDLINNSNIAGLAGAYSSVQYFVNLTSAIDNTTTLSFPGQIYYPHAGLEHKCPGKVVTLGDDSDYTYRVIIGSGITQANVASVPGADAFATSPYTPAGFSAVFDMIKKEKQPAGDDEAQTVTVSYWGDSYLDQMATTEVMASTQSAFLVNEDGSYTLKNWQNSGADLTFNLLNTQVSTSPKYETYGKKNISIVSPTLGGYATSPYIIQKPEGGDYVADLTTKAFKWDVYVYGSGQVTVDIPVQNFTCPLSITRGYCGYEVVEDTDAATTYEVILRTEWKMPNPDYGKEGAASSSQENFMVGGWTKFQFTVAKPEPEPEPEPEPGQYVMTYSMYGTNEYVSKGFYDIEIVDANNIIVKNYLGSGCDIPMVFDTPTEVTGQEYYATGTLMPAVDYRNGMYIKLPDGGTFAAKIPTKDPISNPVFYYSGNFGYVRYYKDGDTMKKSIHLTFGQSPTFYCVDWDMVEGDGSGIEDVVVDENAPAEWFNLQGVRVSGENLAPGIYIKRQGQKTVKVLVK